MYSNCLTVAAAWQHLCCHDDHASAGSTMCGGLHDIHCTIKMTMLPHTQHASSRQQICFKVTNIICQNMYRLTADCTFLRSMHICSVAPNLEVI